MRTIHEVRFALKSLLVLGTLSAIGLVGVIFSGAYDVSATDQHARPVHWALDTGMR